MVAAWRLRGGGAVLGSGVSVLAASGIFGLGTWVLWARDESFYVEDVVFVGYVARGLVLSGFLRCAVEDDMGVGNLFWGLRSKM